MIGSVVTPDNDPPRDGGAMTNASALADSDFDRKLSSLLRYEVIYSRTLVSRELTKLQHDLRCDLLRLREVFMLDVHGLRLDQLADRRSDRHTEAVVRVEAIRLRHIHACDALRSELQSQLDRISSSHRDRLAGIRRQMTGIRQPDSIDATGSVRDAEIELIDNLGKIKSGFADELHRFAVDLVGQLRDAVGH